MNPQDLIEVLKTVPEKRLKLVELSWQVVKEDGGLDQNKLASLAQELELAIEEAQGYSAATEKALWSLRHIK